MPARRTMNLTEAMEISVASLWAHKLRSILTLLGVVIGVTSVITVVSLINGANSYVANKVYNLGADVFGVAKTPFIVTNVDDFLEYQKRRKITLEDYDAVREFCRSCTDVGAAVGGRVETRSGLNSLKDSNLRAWTPSMARLYDVELVSGRHMTETDYHESAPVCVVGWDLVENLMPSVDPLGKEIHFQNNICQVIGVGKKVGTVLGQSRDNWIIIPLTMYRKSYGTQDSIRITCRVANAARMDDSVDEVRQIMRGRRHLAYAAKDDFNVETSQSFLSLWASFSSAFFSGTIAIASVALVVGGIVIMNIMLVSVTERTREIGLRKSIGARRGDILLQFLIESSTIGAIGGTAGALLGILLAKTISWVTPLPATVELWSIAAGLIVAVGVGLFFGIYPASKAARLDPVVALRAE